MAPPLPAAFAQLLAFDDAAQRVGRTQPAHTVGLAPGHAPQNLEPLCIAAGTMVRSLMDKFEVVYDDNAESWM